LSFSSAVVLHRLRAAPNRGRVQQAEKAVGPSPLAFDLSKPGQRSGAATATKVHPL